MSKEKQIEELQKEIDRSHRVFLEDDDYDSLDEYLATMLIEQGYRKSEWISVDERLPERIGKYLVFTVDRRIYICDFIDHYCDGDAQFDDYKVTHWMPLPEAPKMKGGAE